MRFFRGEQGGLIPYVRASNKGRSDSLYFLGGSGRGCPLLRASNEHILIVRVLRARRAPGRSLPSFCFRAPRKGCRERRRSERPNASSLLIAEVQTERTILTATSLSILPTGETFPSRSLRTIRSICTIAPRCQLSTAAL